MERLRIQFLRELCKLQTLKNLLIFHENLFIFFRKYFIASTLCLKFKKTLLNLNLIYHKMQLITGYFLFLSDFCFVGKKRDKVDWNVSIVSKLS